VSLAPALSSMRRTAAAHLFALRGAAVLAGYELSDIAGEIGVLYGRASTGQEARQWSAAIGLSFVQLDLAGMGLRNVIGVPVGVEGSINAPNVGIGVRGFANLNSVRSFAGLALMLRLGRLI